MLKIAALLWIIIAPTTAGILVLISLTAPQLGLASIQTLGYVAVAGFLLAIPIAYGVAAMVTRRLAS